MSSNRDLPSPPPPKNVLRKERKRRNNNHEFGVLYHGISIYLFVCLSIYPSIYLSIYLIYLSIYLSYLVSSDPILSYPILPYPILSSYPIYLFILLNLGQLYTYLPDVVNLCVK